MYLFIKAKCNTHAIMCNSNKITWHKMQLSKLLKKEEEKKSYYLDKGVKLANKDRDVLRE